MPAIIDGREKVAAFFRVPKNLIEMSTGDGWLLRLMYSFQRCDL